MAGQPSSQPVPIGTVIEPLPLTLTEQIFDGQVTVHFAKDGSTFLLFPTLLVIHTTLQVNGNTRPLADANGNFNASSTDTNVVLTVSLLNFQLQTAFRDAVLNAFMASTGAKLEDLGTTAVLGPLRGRLATPNNSAVITKDLVFFANTAQLNQRYNLGAAELEVLQGIPVDELQFFVDATYQAELTQPVFQVKLNLIGSTINRLTTQLTSTSGASGATPPKFLIGVGGDIQAGGNGLQDIRTTFQVQVLLNADINPQERDSAQKIVSDLLASLPGIENNFDVSQRKTSDEFVTFLLGNSVKITAPFNELDEIQQHLDNETEEQLKTDFENALKTNSNVAVSAKGGIGPISFGGDGSSSQSKDQSAKALVDSTKKNLSKLDDIIKGKITNIAALKLDEFQQFVSSDKFTENVSFANFQDSTAVTDDPPFSLVNTLDAAIGTFGVPIGAITHWAGETAPFGWELCRGRMIDLSNPADAEFKALVAVIGNQFGGDGKTTFRLPDFQGRTPVGAGSGNGLTSRLVGQVFGSETHVLSGNELPSHTHTAPRHHHEWIHKGGALNVINSNNGFNTGTFDVKGNDAPVPAGSSAFTSFDGDEPTAGPSSVGDGAAFPIMPPSCVVNMIIKFK